MKSIGNQSFGYLGNQSLGYLGTSNQALRRAGYVLGSIQQY